MKGLYIARIDKKCSLDIGVAKKIDGQINGFKNNNVEMDYLCIDDKYICFKNKKYNKVLAKYFATNSFLKFIKNIDLNYDFIYIRYVIGSISLYRICKYLSEKNIKVIIEIPTYPYVSEINKKNIKNLVSLLVDNLFISKNINKYIYRIATTNKCNEIFKTKTIQISNGVDIQNFKYTDKLITKKQDINMIGIGNLAKWHGYDRLIIALNNYLKQENHANVMFYIIGEGKEKSNLMKLVDDLSIQNNVLFLGAKNGSELDGIFKKMDIGISSLALSRAGGGHDPIKSKEFLGRGLPVVLANDDRLIDMRLPYVIKVEDSEKNIDINEILKKYELLEGVSSKQIRRYASENLSWSYQIKKIINSLN